MKDELVTFFIFIEPLRTCVSLQLALIYSTHMLDAIVYPRLFPPRNIDIANVLHVK